MENNRFPKRLKKIEEKIIYFPSFSEKCSSQSKVYCKKKIKDLCNNATGHFFLKTDKDNTFDLKYKSDTYENTINNKVINININYNQKTNSKKRNTCIQKPKTSINEDIINYNNKQNNTSKYFYYKNLTTKRDNNISNNIFETEECYDFLFPQNSLESNEEYTYPFKRIMGSNNEILKLIQNNDINNKKKGYSLLNEFICDVNQKSIITENFDIFFMFLFDCFKENNIIKEILICIVSLLEIMNNSKNNTDQKYMIIILSNLNEKIFDESLKNIYLQILELLYDIYTFQNVFDILLNEILLKTKKIWLLKEYANYYKNLFESKSEILKNLNFKYFIEFLIKISSTNNADLRALAIKLIIIINKYLEHDQKEILKNKINKSIFKIIDNEINNNHCNILTENKKNFRNNINEVIKDLIDQLLSSVDKNEKVILLNKIIDLIKQNNNISAENIKNLFDIIINNIDNAEINNQIFNLLNQLIKLKSIEIEEYYKKIITLILEQLTVNSLKNKIIEIFENFIRYLGFEKICLSLYEFLNSNQCNENIKLEIINIILNNIRYIKNDNSESFFIIITNILLLYLQDNNQIIREHTKKIILDLSKIISRLNYLNEIQKMNITKNQKFLLIKQIDEIFNKKSRIIKYIKSFNSNKNDENTLINCSSRISHKNNLSMANNNTTPDNSKEISLYTKNFNTSSPRIINKFPSSSSLSPCLKKKLTFQKTKLLENNNCDITYSQTNLYNKINNKIYNKIYRQFNIPNIFLENYKLNKKDKENRVLNDINNNFNLETFDYNNIYIKEINQLASQIFNNNFLSKFFNTNVKYVLLSISELNQILEYENRSFEKITDNLDVILKMLVAIISLNKNNNTLVKGFLNFAYTLINKSKNQKYFFTEIEINILLNLFCDNLVNEDKIIIETASNLIWFLGNSTEKLKIYEQLIHLYSFKSSKIKIQIINILVKISDDLEFENFNAKVIKELFDMYFDNDCNIGNNNGILKLLKNMYMKNENYFMKNIKYLSNEQRKKLSQNLINSNNSRGHKKDNESDIIFDNKIIEIEIDNKNLSIDNTNYVTKDKNSKLSIITPPVENSFNINKINQDHNSNNFFIKTEEGLKDAFEILNNYNISDSNQKELLDIILQIYDYSLFNYGSNNSIVDKNIDNVITFLVKILEKQYKNNFKDNYKIIKYIVNILYKFFNNSLASNISNDNIKHLYIFIISFILNEDLENKEYINIKNKINKILVNLLDCLNISQNICVLLEIIKIYKKNNPKLSEHAIRCLVILNKKIKSKSNEIQFKNIFNEINSTLSYFESNEKNMKNKNRIDQITEITIKNTIKEIIKITNDRYLIDYIKCNGNKNVNKLIKEELKIVSVKKKSKKNKVIVERNTDNSKTDKNNNVYRSFEIIQKKWSQIQNEEKSK